MKAPVSTHGCLLLFLIPFVLAALGAGLTGCEALAAKDYANAMRLLEHTAQRANHDHRFGQEPIDA